MRPTARNRTNDRHAKGVTGFAAAGVSVAAPMTALAAETPAAALVQVTPGGPGYLEAALIATALGIVGFAIAAALAFLRARNRAAEVQSRLDGEIGELRAALDRAETLLDAQDQVMMVWSVDGSPPEIIGHAAMAGGLPSETTAIAAFGTWLDHASSATVEAAIGTLRRSGRAFSRTLATRNGNYVEAIGRTVGGRAVLRLRDITGDQLQTARIADRHDRLKRDIDVMRTLLEGLPMPAWLRDRHDALIWVNNAYVKAVDLADARTVLAENAELLDAAGREALRKARQNGGVVRERLAVVVAGARRSFDVVYLSAEDGSAGIAIDVSELESIESQLQRTIDFHSRTLDQLATAVTIFSADGRLRFYNAAYKALFDLQTAFLESSPEEGAIFDRLRGARRLPEQADYQSWKASLLEAYRSLEPSEHWWHLPDGQTLRVLSTPHPQGGVIRVYENVTEQLDLESRYQSLANVQQESLDNLSEGVVVFGSDGRVSLSNPAFKRIWKLSTGEMDERPHISRIVEWCSLIHDDADVWSVLSAAVTGFDDMRPTLKGRMERIDGSVVDYATVPLPDGATMITFLDVSATVAVERALKEKNEALQAADLLKNAFVEHVSYELRSPLTNIIGFAQLLSDARIGELTTKQREYTDYIMSSSKALLAIINDILDLATIDAGIMLLDYDEVDIAETVNAAVTGVQDRLYEANITLQTDIPGDIGSFVADASRVRQVLYNLLSNAISFSDDGAHVDLRCRRADGEIVFTVSDRGCGMPADYVADAFSRFESRAQPSRRRGVGLGLSLVKNFVDLHGGTVEIDSKEDEGTTVTCRFPEAPQCTTADAAE